MEIKLKSNKPELFIGRLKSSDISLKSETVSRRHARIFFDKPDWLIEDLNSKHGTQINHQALPSGEKKILKNNDRIDIGGEVLNIKIDPIEAQSQNEEPYYFVYLNTDKAGQKLFIPKDNKNKTDFIIGRDDTADIKLDSPNISRKQFKLKLDIDGLWIEDLNSKNGTLLNNHKITKPTKLRDSDELILSDLKLGFVDSNASILKQLSSIPAFKSSEPELESKSEALETKEVQTKSKSPPQAIEPSHWIDYAYMSLMGFVIIGLLIGAFLWVKG